MKILEAQSALLSNYEVLQHLGEQRERYSKTRRRGPPNLEIVVRELLQYLRTYPGPLNQEPLTYSEDCISKLLERLRPYDLTKAEMLMIINIRPVTVATLNTVTEDMNDRFTDDDQEAITTIVAEVLGSFSPDADQPEGGQENGSEEPPDAMAVDESLT